MTVFPCNSGYALFGHEQKNSNWKGTPLVSFARRISVRSTSRQRPVTMTIAVQLELMAHREFDDALQQFTTVPTIFTRPFAYCITYRAVGRQCEKGRLPLFLGKVTSPWPRTLRNSQNPSFTPTMAVNVCCRPASHASDPLLP